MSSKLNLGICCYAYMRGGAVWGMLMELKADMVSFMWSVSECSEARLSAYGVIQAIHTNFNFI